ncbi:xanthine dehydrogenase molybdenum-binding subunit, partial [Galdieria sulphuraria]
MEKNDFDKVFCFINGIPHYIEKPEKLLINYLREDCKLAGTKLGCGEGGCGACTVWIWTVHPVSQQLDCYTINACLVTLAMVDACYIVTVEGIGSRKDELHPIQRLLVQHNGSQCGYCTPGILMSMFGFLEKNKFSKQVLDIEEIESCFDGNLCRCTGYRSIFDAFRSYVQAKETFCIKESISIPEDALQHIFLERRRKLRVWISQQQPHCNKSMYLSETTASPYNSFDRFPIFVRPTNLQETIYYKRLYPDAKFVVGNSEIGIDIKMKQKRWNCFILLNDVQELLHIDDTKSNGWSIGAAVSLSKLLDRIQQLKENQFQFRTLYMLRNQLQRFAGTQIRNVACLGGNIATASPISDINPLLAATNAKLRWISCKHGTYSEANAKDFFVGYRSTLLKEDDLLVDVLIPLTKRNEYVFAYKVSRRVDDDIAIVSAGMRFTCSIISQQSPNDSMLVDTRMNKKIVLEDVSLVYGGMADRTKNAQQTEMVLCGSVLESCSLLSFCRNTLDKDFALKEDSPGGMIEFRRTLACSLLLRSFHRLERLLCNEQIQDSCDELDHSTFSSHATQIFQQLNDEGNGTCHLGRTVPHQSAILQCCGEAQYVDDIPSSSDTLYCAFILSSVPHANILSIDCSEAYNQCPGIKKIFLSQDVPGTNQFAIANNVEDEEVFCSGHVTAVGQIIGMVVADTREHALLGRRMVKVDYERLPAILTIEEARQQQSFEHCCGRKRKWWTFPPHFIEQGNVEEEFHRTDLLQIRGNVKIGAQEHFYLETHGCLAIPGENDELVIYVSTQSPSKTQMVIAHVLGLPSHKVVCKTKRIGGGFGGKETRNIFISCAVAVAAHTLKKPIRIYLDREDDMVMTGHRHPFFGDYRVAFDRLGKIHAVETLLFANIGNSLDLSMAVLDRALFHSENVYHIPNIRIVGRLCWTHTISNTAFRGFGGPQGMAIAETWIHHVASALMMNPETVRSLNMYGVGENSLTTPYGMKLLGYSGWECWQSVMESSDFWKRKQTVNEYNANHRYRKRGIAAVPTKFGISFTNKTYNQAGVLIHVYLDGSVLVSHGGVEMN